jgi:hypothetical protein
MGWAHVIGLFSVMRVVCCISAMCCVSRGTRCFAQLKRAESPDRFRIQTSDDGFTWVDVYTTHSDVDTWSGAGFDALTLCNNGNNIQLLAYAWPGRKRTSSQEISVGSTNPRPGTVDELTLTLVSSSDPLWVVGVPSVASVDLHGPIVISVHANSNGSKLGKRADSKIIEFMLEAIWLAMQSQCCLAHYEFFSRLNLLYGRALTAFYSRSCCHHACYM